MDRRRFLAGVAATAASAALPIPALASVMPPAPSVTSLAGTGNVLLTADQVAAEALRILRMNYAMASLQHETAGPLRIADSGGSLELS